MQNRRPRLPDPVTRPSDNWADYLVNHALLPLDEVTRRMERKWGIDRLPALVSPELATRWGNRMAELDAAISRNDPDAVKVQVDMALRGLAALDQAATAAGAAPASADCLQGEYEGFRFGILPDDRQWRSVQDEYPGLRLFTLREVGLALMMLAETGVGRVKQTFPGAEVVAIRKRLGPLPDDEIPF